MFTINIKLDLEKDAWNWWEACNKVSHGVDWKQKISDELREKITDKSKEEAFIFLLPYLRELYSTMEIQKYIEEMQIGFGQVKDKLFDRMERVTNRPIYRNDFTCFLTSFHVFLMTMRTDMSGFPIKEILNIKFQSSFTNCYIFNILTILEKKYGMSWGRRNMRN